MRRFAGFAVVTVASLAISSAAHAEISVCNDFHAPIRVALAQPTRTGVPSTGWWRIDPGLCRSIGFQLAGDTLYYRAVADRCHQGPATACEAWGEKKRLFVSDGNFTLDDATRRSGDARPTMFGVTAIPAGGVFVRLRFANGRMQLQINYVEPRRFESASARYIRRYV